MMKNLNSYLISVSLAFVLLLPLVFGICLALNKKSIENDFSHDLSPKIKNKKTAMIVK